MTCCNDAFGLSRFLCDVVSLVRSAIPGSRMKWGQLRTAQRHCGERARCVSVKFRQDNIVSMPRLHRRWKDQTRRWCFQRQRINKPICQGATGGRLVFGDSATKRGGSMFCVPGGPGILGRTGSKMKTRVVLITQRRDQIHRPLPRRNPARKASGPVYRRSPNFGRCRLLAFNTSVRDATGRSHAES